MEKLSREGACWGMTSQDKSCNQSIDFAELNLVIHMS